MRISQSVVLAFGMSAFACSASESLPEALGTLDQAILYGAPDTTHQAVVALWMHSGGDNWGSCTGTIIDVKGSTGYVLTAAHCVTQGETKNVMAPSQISVAMGNDYYSPSVSFPVTAVSIHPFYTGLGGSSNDFAMIRFSGATSSTPIIPAMTPAQDDLKQNTEVKLVGYGNTESGANSIRRFINKPIGYLDVSVLQYAQPGTTGGMCFGDSGGPTLTLGTERVAAVASYVTADDCKGYGVSGRVSMVYNSFVKPFLDGTTGEYTCDECWEGAFSPGGACWNKRMACFENQKCIDYITCGNKCYTAACWHTCAAQHAQGAAMWNDATTVCRCDNCSKYCSSEPRCNMPACGVEYEDALCGKCSDSKCCVEAQACADSSACAPCLVSNPPASCNSSAKYNAWQDCLSLGCASECSLLPDGCGLAIPKADCQECVENACCDQAKACADNATCKACAEASEPSASCHTNALYGDLQACQVAGCVDECVETPVTQRPDGGPDLDGGAGGGGSDKPDTGAGQRPSGGGDGGSGGGCSTTSHGAGMSHGGWLFAGLAVLWARWRRGQTGVGPASRGARRSGSVQSG